MNKFNTSLLLKLSQNVELTPYENAYNLISELLDEAITNLKNRNSLIGECELLIANEVFTNKEYFGSSLDLFLFVDAAMVELNYEKKYGKKENKFIKASKNFGKNFINNLKLFKFKKKNKNQAVSTEPEPVQNYKIDEYNIVDFYVDLNNELAKLLYVKTSIKIDKNKIEINGDEEFGVKINIYPVFTSADNKNKIYDLNNNTFTYINFSSRFENVEAKNQQTNGMFDTQVRLFNNLYWTILNKAPNQIFIESLLFSAANELYTNDVIQTFILIINYLKNVSPYKINSVCNTGKCFLDDVMCGVNLERFIKFRNSIKIDMQS